jgi:hypothetical protein
MGGFESAAPAALTNNGLDSELAGAVLPKLNIGFVSWAVVDTAAPKRLLACVAGAAAAVPKMLLVSVVDAAGVLAAPKRVFVSADFSGSAAGVGAPEPNRESVFFVSVLPKANFGAAGPSLWVTAGAAAAPKMLPEGFVASVEKSDGVGVSALDSVACGLPNRPPPN